MTDLDKELVFTELKQLFGAYPSVSSRIANMLIRYGITTIRQIVETPEYVFCDMRHFGVQCQEGVAQVRERLSRETGLPLT